MLRSILMGFLIPWFTLFPVATYAANTGTQFPPTSAATCLQQFQFDGSDFGYIGKSNAKSMIAIAAVCEQAAKDALAYKSQDVPADQKQMIAAWGYLAAATVLQGNPLHKDAQALQDLHLSMIQWKAVSTSPNEENAQFGAAVYEALKDYEATLKAAISA